MQEDPIAIAAFLGSPPSISSFLARLMGVLGLLGGELKNAVHLFQRIHVKNAIILFF